MTRLIGHRKRRGYRWQCTEAMLVELVIVLCCMSECKNVVRAISQSNIVTSTKQNSNDRSVPRMQVQAHSSVSSKPPPVEGADYDVSFNLTDSRGQLDTNFYNISVASNWTRENPSHKIAGKEELSTSDSKYHHSISRDDDETTAQVADTPTEEDTMGDIENYIDEASSNLNEKKVIKEFTKMLSRGMSGATDQVRLETLENWKRRQKERKVVKDTRAKLFEDILSAAISSHPEKIKKRTRKMKVPSNKQTFPGLSSNPELDPEMAADADNVISHLSGLASVMDSNPSAPSAYQSGELPENTENILPIAEGEEGESTESEREGKASSNPDSKQPDRLIVKQFKKIKHQISQRRKQLDHIRKLFNVELSINPKDGSLVGKSTKKSKDHESLDEDLSRSQVLGKNYPKRFKPKSQVKVKELMDYLRDNPEILASVMSELTVDADSRIESGGRSQSGFPVPGSVLKDDESHIVAPDPEASLNVRRTTTNHLKGHDLGRLMDEYQNSPSPPRKTWSRHNHFDVSNMESPEAAYSTASVRRARDNEEPHLHPAGSTSMTPQLRVKSAEALLLESLRERQLMNLARLDAVLAERQLSSNRSHTHGTSLNATISRRDSIDHRKSISPLRVSRDNHLQGSSHGSMSQNQPRKQSDSEVLHHFMMVNQDNRGGSSSAGSSLVRDSGDQLSHGYMDRIPPPSSPAFSQLMDDQRGPNQYSPLGRFKEWRDVSQVETSASIWNDPTKYPSNVTWVPYDLSTGGSSNSITDAHKSASTIDSQYHRNPIILKNQNFSRSDGNDVMSRQDLTKATDNQQDDPSQREHGDSSVTRPGSSRSPDSDQANSRQSYQAVNDYSGSDRSGFATRSTIGKEVGAVETSASDGPPPRTIKTGPSTSQVYPPEQQLGRTGADAPKSHIEQEYPTDSDDRLQAQVDTNDAAVSRQRRNGAPSIDYFSAYKQEISTNRRADDKSSSPNDEVAANRSSPRRQAPGRADTSVNELTDMDKIDDMGAMWAKSR